MGQTVGVLHGTAPDGSPPTEQVSVTMEQLAVRMGDRLGVIRAFQRSETQATTDPLTGLLNRRNLEEQVAAMLRAGRMLTVAFGDLDHFKQLNDTHGHESGDRALRLFSKTLRDCARKEDFVSRWGGEEFLVVLPDTTAEQGCAFAERVREALTLNLTSGTTPAFTVSFGFSDTTDGDRFEDLVALADGALLAAKRAGRNRAVLASSLVDDEPVPEATVS
jgi:diguanylate cyclase (GGDEF)-like protein